MAVAHQLDRHQPQSLGVELGDLPERDLVTAVDDPVLCEALLLHRLSKLLASGQARPLEERGGALRSQ